MKPVSVIPLATVFYLAAACTPGSDRSNPPDTGAVGTAYEDAAEVVRQFIAHEMEAKGLPAVSVALVDDQRVVWAEGFGWEREGVPATAETVYRVGSVSKLFTDLAMMQLVEEGRLDLDAPITDVLPEFTPRNPHGGEITLRQLTSHRAGLVREPPVGHYFDDTEPTLAETVESLVSTELVFPPEARSKYSNAGIAVVGRALEVVTGEEFAAYLENRVLRPMGMESSSFRPTDRTEARLADALMWTLDGRTFPAPTFQLGMSPAGSMYSTVVDLGRFMSVLFSGGEADGGRVLTSAALDTMWTPQFEDPGTTTGYGIGFRIGELDGHRSVGHGGAIYGFSTELLALPDARLGVVVVTSLDIANTLSSRIARATLRAALASRSAAPVPEPVTTRALDPDVAESQEGRYTNAAGAPAFDLLELGGRLFLDFAAGGQRLELRALGDTLITDDPKGYGMRLVPTDVGLTGNGTAFRREEVPEPSPSRGEWAGLVGEYGWDHNVLYIREDGGTLSALVEWFFEYPLEQVGRDQFRFPDGGLYVNEALTFERDGNGRALRAVLGGSVVFERRAMDGESGETFKIEPVQSLEELRESALSAEPPAETGEFVASDLVDVTTLDPGIRLDIRYASTNNFMDAAFYDEPRAFLQRPAAEALARANARLGEHGLGLLVHDGYRPWYVTKMFWDATPEDQKLFVANPANGSRHNRGAAVDLTLYRLSDGAPVEMVSGYDEFSPRAFPDYPGGTSLARWYRELLREAMEDEGFAVYEWEWWHFDYSDWPKYRIGNETFAELGR